MGDAESMEFWCQEIERIAEARGIQLRDSNGPIKEKSDGTKKLDFGTQVCSPLSLPFLEARIRRICLLTTLVLQLKAYKKKNVGASMGGNHFDLSKISEAERRRLDEGNIFEI